MATLYDKTGEKDVSIIIDSQRGSNRLSVESRIVGGINGIEGPWHWSRISSSNINNTFSSVFSITSSNSAFYGCIFKSDSDLLQMKITVDDSVIFDFHLKADIKDLFKLGKESIGVFPYVCEYEPNRFRFEPPECFIVSQSLSIEFKSTSGNKTVENGIVVWRESL
jgi:hypothetical protein